MQFGRYGIWMLPHELENLISPSIYVSPVIIRLSYLVWILTMDIDGFRDVPARAVSQRHQDYAKVKGISLRWDDDDANALFDKQNFQGLLSLPELVWLPMGTGTQDIQQRCTTRPGCNECVFPDHPGSRRHWKAITTPIPLRGTWGAP